MATRRARKKSQRSTRSRHENTDDDDDYHSMTIKEEPDSSGKDSPFQGMSLDVLAQVATEKLQNEPATSRGSPVKKLTKRSIQSLDVLTLEQIRMLSDKSLINMFSEASADEIKRTYEYTCYLMPDSCTESFSSFGNENRARLKIRSHLLQHIGELLQSSSCQEESQDDFMAEPIYVRKKRLSAETSIQKKYKKKASYVPASPKAKGQGQPRSKSPVQNTDMFGNKQKDLVRTSPRSQKNKSRSEETAKRVSPAKKTKKVKSFERDTLSIMKASSYSVTVTTAEVNPSPLTSSACGEQSVIEKMNERQPHQDHCYTSIFGKKEGADELHFELENMEDMDENDTCRFTSNMSSTEGEYAPAKGCMIQNQTEVKTVRLKINSGDIPSMNSIHIPVIKLPKSSHIPLDETPAVSAVEEVVDIPTPAQIQAKELATHRSYPPMPKSDLAMYGRVEVNEEEEGSSSDEEQDTEPKLMPVKTPRRKDSVGTAEWERKTALKCIKELRCKKKDEDALSCKICPDKAFTATATLMYHYRSHAGIKPFVCLICNTTFTRQHSLNYHMLIHNNQSRFTCKDCGRKFRHPSHFKEHLRRHTGETPFHCSDCPLRFKTRNTYKRHLKTRHGKLLTAHGIRSMTAEEFAKVRTKPQKNKTGEDEDGDDIDESEDIEEEEDEEMLEEASAESTEQPNKLLQFCSQVVGQEISTS